MNVIINTAYSFYGGYSSMPFIGTPHYQGAILFFIGVIYFMYASQCNGKNIIMIIIAQEQIILSIGFLFVNQSYNLDDMIGQTQTLYLLPIAGAESAIGQAFLVAYYPQRGTISFVDLSIITRKLCLYK